MAVTYEKTFEIEIINELSASVYNRVLNYVLNHELNKNDSQLIDRAAHQIDQSLGDAQSQAGPFHLGDLFAPVKWFEQSVEEFITDADSGILNCEAVAYASVPLCIDQ